MDIKTLTIKEFHDGLLSRNFTAKEMAQEFFDLIDEEDGEIHAFLRKTKDLALSEAAEVDEILSRGEDPGVLAGVPVALKDNMLVEGEAVHAASKILLLYRGSYDATAVRKLKEAKMVILGQTNMDEFAMGSSTENSAFGPTRNPHDLERVPGGSSGGSAAAVASGMAIAALGSDTGGSIRQPAAFCGVVGLKPTYGAVSRFGLIAMASSLDQIGPFAKTVEDAAILFNAIAGHDKFDATSVVRDYDDVLALDNPRTKELRIGLPKEYFIDGLSKDVQAGMDEAVQKFKKLGFKIKEISLPHTKYALSVYYIIMPAEVSTNLARFDGIRYSRISPNNVDGTQTDAESSQGELALSQRRSALEEIYFQERGRGLGKEARRRVLLGTFVLSAGYYDAYYTKAQKVRRLIKNDFDEAFREVDVILAPVTPTSAFKFGEKTGDPLQMYLSDIFTIPANLAGLPALSMPVKKYEIGSGELPVGLQLIGKRFREADILRVGALYGRD